MGYDAFRVNWMGAELNNHHGDTVGPAIADQRSGDHGAGRWGEPN